MSNGWDLLTPSFCDLEGLKYYENGCRAASPGVQSEDPAYEQ
jgi:hypothetical protein